MAPGRAGMDWRRETRARSRDDSGLQRATPLRAAPVSPTSETASGREQATMKGPPEIAPARLRGTASDSKILRLGATLKKAKPLEEGGSLDFLEELDALPSTNLPSTSPSGEALPYVPRPKGSPLALAAIGLAHCYPWRC